MKNCLFTILILCSSTILNISALKKISKSFLKADNKKKLKSKLELLFFEYIELKKSEKKNPKEKTDLLKIDKDNLGESHASFQVTYDGIPVFGKDFKLHANDQNKIYYESGEIENGERNISTTPTISSKEAIDCALKHADPDSKKIQSELKEELNILPTKNGDKLCYKIEIDFTKSLVPSKPVLFVNAHNCQIEFEYNNLKMAKVIDVYNAHNGSALPGTAVRSDDTETGDLAVDAAYVNASKTYDFLHEMFGRDSWNNKGGVIIESVHFERNYANAYWDGTQVVYGDGDGTNLGLTSNDLNVVAHEMGHGIVEADSNLIYDGESGALNESFADIIGCGAEWFAEGKIINDNTWKIGEGVYTPDVAGDALRLMNNPSEDGSSKDCYSERYIGTDDNGGVHWNSGIPNLVFYLLVVGGTHPRNVTQINVKGIGMEKALAIFYRANDLYYTSQTTFFEARQHTERAAKDLYQDDIVESVSQAWAAVQVGTYNPITN